MKIQDITEGYGRYYCSTDKKWKTRKGPKQTRKTESANQGVTEGGFKNKTAVFSGYSNYMRSRAPNVFKQLDIKVLNKEYFEDEDIIEYTVISDGDSLAKARATLETNPQFGGMILKQGVAEEKQRLDAKCWAGYKKQGTKMKGDTRVNNCVKEDLEETYDGDEFFEAYGELWFNEDEQLNEAEYQGRSVPLGKPMQGDVKKFKVYVKDPSTGNVKKVNFGDPDMKIRKSNPAARRSFRARHNCDNPGPRTKARYWSCRKW